MLKKALYTLRVWMGLADTSESHLTPDHGWLLPAPVDARRQRMEADTLRAEHRRQGKAQG
ncbi:MAG TPA: hypothetical protein VL691_07515 [Vicinamibacteria bacterium]|nr:hypothetical protein [Vicinamibacteria bacterium]